LALVPEDDLKERMRPAGKWAVTATPIFARASAELKISCATEGASIAWTTEPGGTARWQLYARPIRLDRSATVRAKACRLGYRDSIEVQTNFEIA
jgi:uncharacterized sulfatase